jgi:RNA polymerase sigma-70 factor (ECF subfamily)
MSNEFHNRCQDSGEEKTRLERRVLVLRAMKGDLDAFESLFRMHHARLFYYMRRLVDNVDNADDAMQEAWIQIYRSLPSLKAPEAFLVWCYRIARNVAAQHIRDLRRELQQADLSPECASTDDHELPRLASAELVHEGLKRVKPLHREVLILRYLQDMTYEQIAQVTSTSVNTVKSRLHYAKQSMLEAVKGLENER